MTQTILIIIAISLLVLAIGLMVYILYENRHFHVTTYEYKNEKIPASFDDAVMLYISDLHGYSYGNKNSKLIQAVKEAKPDYILIGGDMLVKGTNFDGSVSLELVRELTKLCPVYYAFGNHELRISTLPETSDTTYVEYIDELKKAGVHLLIDEKTQLTRNGSSIHLYGLNLPEFYYEKFKKHTLNYSEIEKRLGTVSDHKFSLLLAHNPVYFPAYANWGADLVLSGHVHGGMIALPVIGGVMSTQGLLFPNYDFGLYEKNSSTMILSRGLGNHTIHIRINNRAELIKLVLKHT